MPVEIKRFVFLRDRNYKTPLYARDNKDAEKLDFVTEELRKWKLEEAVGAMCSILDQIKLWAFKNEFKIKETKII